MNKPASTSKGLRPLWIVLSCALIAVIVLFTISTINSATTKMWILSGILVPAGLILLVLYRRKYRSPFTEKYWHDVPDKDLHPVVVSRMWAWNRKKQKHKDIPIVLMHLANIGAIRLVKKTNKKGISYYVLELLPENDADLTELDKQILKTVFKGSKKFAYVKTMQKRFTDKTQVRSIEQRIERLVDKQAKRLGTFLVPSMRTKFIIGIVTTLFALIYFYRVITGSADNGVRGVFLLFTVCATIFTLSACFSTGEGSEYQRPLWLMATIAGGYSFYQYEHVRHTSLNVANMLSLIGVGLILIFAIFGLLTLRPPLKVQEIIAKSNALKRWLEDFTLLDEKLPSDVKVWDELMVYATAFGVADKTLKQIDKALPVVSNDSMFKELAAWVKKDDNATAPFDLLVSVFSENTPA